MRPLAHVLLIATLLNAVPDLFGQTMSRAFPDDLDIDLMTRLTNGGYIAQEYTQQQALIGFNSTMIPNWRKTYGFPETGYQLVQPDPNGGVRMLVNSGPTYVGKDSVLFTLNMVRLDMNGEVTNVRKLELPSWTTLEIEELYCRYFSVNEAGESFLSLFTGSSDEELVLKLDSADDPLWMVSLGGLGGLAGAPTPDGQGGCFFTSRIDGFYETLYIGHLLADGSTGWCKSLAPDGGDYSNLMQVRVAPSGDLFLAGAERENNLVVMELSAAGELLMYRLLGQTSPTPGSGLLLHGFELLSDGRMLVVHGGSLGTRMTLLDANGAVTTSYTTQIQLVDGWNERLSLIQPIIRGTEITLNGYMNRQEQVFNFEEGHYALLTFPYGADDLCHVFPSPAPTILLDLDDIAVNDMPPLSSVGVPTSSTGEVTVTALSVPIMSEFCAVGTGLAEDQSNGGFRVSSYPVSAGLHLQVVSSMPCQLQVLDMAGRTIQSARMRNAGSAELQLPQLCSGVYVVRAVDELGSKVHTVKVIVH